MRGLSQGKFEDPSVGHFWWRSSSSGSNSGVWCVSIYYFLPPNLLLRHLLTHKSGSHVCFILEKLWCFKIFIHRRSEIWNWNISFLFLSRISDGKDVNISALLNSFQMGYDKRVRPNYGGKAFLIWSIRKDTFFFWKSKL